jgi:hypothetical protein
MSFLDWLTQRFKGKSHPQASENIKVPPEADKSQVDENPLIEDPQQRLWAAESSAAMKSLISNSNDEDLGILVNSLAFAEFPLNALASGGSSLDKRSTLTVHFAYQLLKRNKHAQANQLLMKILDKMRAKLVAGSRVGGAIAKERGEAFESAFASGDLGSATEILKQHRSTDFWRIDEALKQELYDLAMELLRRDKSREVAILLDAVMLDYPQDLDTEFWRAAAYHNFYGDNKADMDAKEKARKAIETFIHKAEGNLQFLRQCSDLREILNSKY